MDVREKLVELANDVLRYLPWGEIQKDTAEQIADRMMDHGVTVQEWISVNDRLPEIDQPCLCYKKRNGHCCYQLGTYIGASFSEDCAAFKSMSHYGCIGVTHWMPLPQPPKGE